MIAEMVALARNAGIMVEKLPETVGGGVSATPESCKSWGLA